MPQVKVVAQFGLEQIGNTIDLDAKDAEQKVAAGLAEYVEQPVEKTPEPVQAEVQKIEEELQEVKEEVAQATETPKVEPVVEGQ